MAKDKHDEVIEVYEPNTCPVPDCNYQGAHRHVISVIRSPHSSRIEGYGEATAIENLTDPPVPWEQPESEQ